MISREKVLEIMRGIEAKVAKGQTKWNADEPDDTSVSGFWLDFPTSALYLRYNSPPAEFDNVEIEIRNDDELVVAFVRIDEEDEDWAWIKPLFDEVERQVTGSDRILEEIEGALRSGNEIGIKYDL